LVIESFQSPKLAIEFFWASTNVFSIIGSMVIVD